MSPRPRTVRTIATVALCAGSLLVAACTGEGEDENRRAAVAIPATTAAPTTTTTTTAPQPCAEAVLVAAAADTDPGASLLDVTCATTAAMATIQGGSTQGGTGVAFFVLGADGTWAVVDVVDADADLAAALPAGAPGSLVGAWQNTKFLRENPQARTTTTDIAPPATDDAGNERPL